MTNTALLFSVMAWIRERVCNVLRVVRKRTFTNVNKYYNKSLNQMRSFSSRLISSFLFFWFSSLSFSSFLLFSSLLFFHSFLPSLPFFIFHSLLYSLFTCLLSFLSSFLPSSLLLRLNSLVLFSPSLASALLISSLFLSCLLFSSLLASVLIFSKHEEIRGG